MHGAAPAPYRALDLIEGAATWSLEEGYRAEEDALAELLPGPQAQASIYAFGLVERRAKRGVGVPDAEPRRVEKIGLVGAGLMARQLALLALRRLEVPVALRDLTQEQIDDALSWIDRFKPRRAVITNMHSDLDYEVLRQSLPPNVIPAYDGMRLTLEQAL